MGCMGRAAGSRNILCTLQWQMHWWQNGQVQSSACCVGQSADATCHRVTSAPQKSAWENQEFLRTSLHCPSDRTRKHQLGSAAYSEVSQMRPLILSRVSPAIYTSPLKVIQDECYYLLNIFNKTQANRNILETKYCCITQVGNEWKGHRYSKKFKNFHIYSLEAESFLSTVKPWCNLFRDRRCTLLEEKLYPLY